jgi:phage major head subunit gpT-like protein
MPVPHTSANFTDILDPRFEAIWNDEYNQHEDMIGEFYATVPSNGRNNMTFSSISTLDDFSEFAGTVQYQDQTQGYDSTMTYKEFVSGFQLERKLWDDDQYQIWDDSPRALAASAFRTRQKHAARMFNNAFSVDSLFYVNTEGVALCSDSHTTTTGASTATGFDNKITGELTAVSVATARIQMVNFRGQQAEIISVKPDTLLYPPDLYEQAYEIINSPGKLDTANNNANVHQGRFRGLEWNFLNDTNNWFMMDSTYMKLMLKWCDRVALEYGFVEDFDTYTAKYRAYMRYAMIWRDWRFILGSQVT